MPSTDQTIAAVADAVAPATLERLARLDARGRPILSMYLNLDPTRFPTPGTRDAELGALVDDARRQGGEQDADRVKSWLTANPTIGRPARGLAIFSEVDATEHAVATGAKPCGQAGGSRRVFLPSGDHDPAERVIVDARHRRQPVRAVSASRRPSGASPSW